jgi:probable HAF family extracellular repeat protein
MAMFDLNNMIVTNAGWTLSEAKAISDNGQIVGLAISTTGAQHAFLLTPVPEPAVISLFGLAGTAYIFSRSRKSPC